MLYFETSSPTSSPWLSFGLSGRMQRRLAVARKRRKRDSDRRCSASSSLGATVSSATATLRSQRSNPLWLTHTVQSPSCAPPFHYTAVHQWSFQVSSPAYSASLSSTALATIPTLLPFAASRLTASVLPAAQDQRVLKALMNPSAAEDIRLIASIARLARPASARLLGAGARLEGAGARLEGAGLRFDGAR